MAQKWKVTKSSRGELHCVLGPDWYEINGAALPRDQANLISSAPIMKEALEALSTERRMDYMQKYSITPSVSLQRNVELIAEHALKHARGLS